MGQRAQGQNAQKKGSGVLPTRQIVDTRWLGFGHPVDRCLQEELYAKDADDNNK